MSNSEDSTTAHQERFLDKVQELQGNLGQIMSLIAGESPVDFSFDGYNKMETGSRENPVIKRIMTVTFSDVYNPYTGKMTQNAANIAQNARDIFGEMDKKKSNFAKCYINTTPETNRLDFDFDKLTPLEKSDFNEAAFFIIANKTAISGFRERIREKTIKIEGEQGKKVLVINRAPRGID